MLDNSTARTESFESLIDGAYCLDYDAGTATLQKLYRLGKLRGWNAEVDLNWSGATEKPRQPYIDGLPNPFAGWAPFEALAQEQQDEFYWHHFAWSVSQFLHGEQGALLVSAQLVNVVPSCDAKLYAASQTFDEARHVEAFSSYLRHRVGRTYPISEHLKCLLDTVLKDPRWDVKFIGMQLIIESLAMAAFGTLKLIVRDPLFVRLIELVSQDESRHVAFGLHYLQEAMRNLSPSEREQRAEFAYQACYLMNERLVGSDIVQAYGWDEAEARRRLLASSVSKAHRNMLFARVIPNLNRLGLLTESVRPRYESLGLLEHELQPTLDTGWDS